MSKVILLTGSTGYIGGDLVSVISQKTDWEVIEVSRNNGYDLAGANWTNKLPDRAVDVVVHLAQSRHYRNFPESSSDIFQVNLASTLELLEWARKHQVKRFIFASSGNVYKRTPGLLKETDQCQPESMYDVTKLSGEYLVKQYSVFFETIIMRIFGVYGPGQKKMIIPNIIERIKTGQEITLAEAAGLYLTPLYIEDCLEMILSLITIPLRSTSNIFNLAGNETVHLGQIVEIVENILQIKAKIRLTDDEPIYLQGSNYKLCQAINFQPLVSIKEGLLKMIQESKI